ncbi:tRNA nucleotidyltransferase (CCA-adding enzyme) [Anaerobranca californiensis DSM 14826]|uniref:tRNA nucleotidyltransferase (CCA-adding enzyme) n=1 Tax=Anaerobranca californiensis DSM 14826 TaxID=1120989 RepID=A0A1M6L1U4_9FIRM|nr:CBS domain-containing protein [Anaerobranca californiensis]SHJ65089.1 tRNA nucleotidyltransferase (CCA-adding enzyme) [Anaerobranca californiensis DSM 14826]
MDIIITHTNTDFDGFASMVACTKLYPGAKMVFPGKLNKNVKEFYSLHKDSFDVMELSKINPEKIKRLIIVDTSSSKRLGSLGPLLSNENIQVIIYDHHPVNEELMPHIKGVFAQVGATVTILVEAMKEREIKITPFEATVLALGIYEDTGSLTYPSTTVRDVNAVSYLLQQGAKLSLVGEYISKPLNQGQRELLNKLMDNIEHLKVNNWNIAITTAYFDDFIGGIGEITKKLGNIDNVDAIFSVVYMVDRVHVVGRSLKTEVSILECIQKLGGNGHKMAAAVTIKGKSVDEVVNLLKENLHLLPSPLLARDIMTKPVKTIPSTVTIEEANRLMLRYGHTGFPVVEEGKLVGIISRRDVDKAIHHKLGHSPVKGFMSRNIVKVKENTSISEIQRALIQKDIGRVPVVDDNDNIIGIITRTDILKLIHGEELPRWHKPLYSPGEYNVAQINGNLTNLINSRLPKKVQGLLLLIGQKAQKEGYKAYAIGGFVRDLLLGVENLDIDIVVEENAISFAEKLVKYIGGNLKTYPNFGTATLTLKDGSKIDFATARMEFYPFPAALPEVEETTIKHDLYRRDFTINTLGFKLNSPVFGDFLDFFNGKKDLEDGIIRVLYNLSFVEDPTRILRAIRFEARYGFKIEEQTLAFMENAINNNMLEEVKVGRMADELKLMLSEKTGLTSFKRAMDLGIIDKIFGEIEDKDRLLKEMETVNNLMEICQVKGISIDEPFLVYLRVILSHCREHIRIKFLKGMNLEKNLYDDLMYFFEEYKGALEKLRNPKFYSPSELVEILGDFSHDSLIPLTAISGSNLVKRRVFLYLEELSKVSIETKGEDLLELGFKPGPIFSEIMENLRKEKLDGNISNKEEEIIWVKSHYLPKLKDGVMTDERY